MRMSRKAGLIGGGNTLLKKFFESLDPDEVWRSSKDSSSSTTLYINQANEAFPTTPNFRVIFFCSGDNCVIGIYNSTSKTWKTCASTGSKTVTLSGTTLNVSGNLYAGVFFTTYSSWSESDVDDLLSRVSITPLGGHTGSSAKNTFLTTEDHVANPSWVYLTTFTTNGSNNAYFNVSPCNDIFSPIIMAPPSETMTQYIRDPNTEGYVASCTATGSGNAAGRSGAFYRLSL